MIPLRYEREAAGLDLSKPLSQQASGATETPGPAMSPEEVRLIALRAELAEVTKAAADDSTATLRQRLEQLRKQQKDSDQPKTPTTPVPAKIESSQADKIKARLHKLKSDAQSVRDRAAASHTSPSPPPPKSASVPTPPTPPPAAEKPPDSVDLERVRLLQLRKQLEDIQSTPPEKLPEPSKTDRIIQELKKELDKAVVVIEKLQADARKYEEDNNVLRMDLDDREQYLRENITLLQEGRDIYNEAVAAYQELATEVSRNAEGRVASLNDSSKKRIRELDVLNSEIRAMEQVLAWYGQNRIISQKSVLMSIGMVRLEDHLKHGRPFSDEFRYLELSAEKDSLLEAACGAVPPGLRASGVPTKKQLMRSWDELELSAREAVLVPKEPRERSLWRLAMARIFGLLLLRERINQPGDDLQSRISRAGFFLEHDNLRGAVAEVESLPPLAQGVLKEWIGMAKERLLAIQTFAVIRDDITLRSP